MSLYLHARVGDYRLLLPAERVLEVWPGRAGEDTGRWRTRDVPVIDLRTVLGTPIGNEAVYVAYGAAPDDAAAIVLTLDGVVGLLALATDALASLPAISARTAALFDAITREPVGARHLLRLKLQPDFVASAAG